MTESILQAVNVSRQFGSNRVLSGIDLSFTRGEFAALLGPNGGGKTTFLRICSGLLRPSGGEVLYKGTPLNKAHNELIRNAGYFPEFPSLYDELTVWENLLFFGRLKGLSSAQIKNSCEIYLVRLGLVDVLKSRARTLSKGTKYKVSLCRAFMGSPAILFMDEPATGLAPEVVEFILEMLREQRKKGTTLIYTSHNMDVTSSISDRIILINRTVEAEGTFQEFSDKYFTPCWRLELDESSDELTDRVKAVGGVKVTRAGDGYLMYERNDGVQDQSDILKIAASTDCGVISLTKQRQNAGEIYKEVFSKAREDDHEDIQ